MSDPLKARLLSASSLPLPQFLALDDAAARISEARHAALCLSPWAVAMHDSLSVASTELNAKWRRCEQRAALVALKSANEWQPLGAQDNAGNTFGQLTVASISKAGPSDPTDIQQVVCGIAPLLTSSPSDTGGNGDSADEKGYATDFGDAATDTTAHDNAIDGEIERILRSTGTLVRVQAKGTDGDPRPFATKTAHMMAINDAAQAFSVAWEKSPVGLHSEILGSSKALAPEQNNFGSAVQLQVPVSDAGE